MRLHRLSMTAFGPFAGTEVVDFDMLSDAGLFLLHGPTGAGKTCVLDAVCYALYGQVPGARATGRARLRSDHAPLDRCPQVQLDLTVAGRRLEVTRTPEWSRPKKRGSGVTTVPASTRVRELVGGGWHPLTTRNDEAGQLLLDLLGMGHEQFTKVVLLPQGEFAAFLRSDAEQRRTLLSRLFDIERFDQVEAWLTNERSRLAREVKAGEQHTQTLLARAAEAFAGLPVPDDVELPTAATEAKPAQRVTELLQRAESIARGTQVRLEVLIERASTAHAALLAATDLQGRRVRWARATAQLSELEGTAAAHAVAAARVADARRAAPVAGLVEALDAAVAEAVQVADQVRSVRRAVPAEAVELDQKGLRRVLSTHRVLVASLHDAVQRAAELKALDQRIAALATRRETAQVSAGRAAAAADQAAAKVEQATAEGHEAALLAADLTAAQEAEVAASSLAVLVSDRRAVDVEVAAATGRRSAAIDADQHAREYYLHLWQRRLADIAGELASDLKAGEACRVCGSCEHPAPAELAADHVGREAVEAAARAADEARIGREAAERAHARLVTRQCELTALTRGCDEEGAAAALADARARVRLTQEAADAAKRAASAQLEARARLEQALASQRQWATVVTKIATTLADLTERRASLAADLDRLRGDDADVAVRRLRLERETAALESLIDAVGALETAERLVAEHRERLAAAWARHGFAAEGQARAAIMPLDVLEELTATVAEHDRLRGDALAKLAEPDLRGVEDLPEPHLEQSQADVQQRNRELSVARSQASMADAAVRRLAQLVREVARSEDSLAPVRDELDRVEQLTACVLGTGGDNQLRMRLSAYVLAARLEEVAAAATERLDVMSDGRYALVHSDERAKGGGRSGLGLRVVDAWTGVERDTATLSGGESFLASLALALGLADVVQAEAAGSAIETLFIDEGFGTLDDETLEEVMTVLDGLRDGGRAVGLVSHVADLRTRIPSQLEVRKSRSGSTLVQHTSALSSCSG